MARSEQRVILASASPRRRELLERFGLPFEVIPARGEERAPEGLTPAELVERLSRAKAGEVAAAAEDREAVIIAADTVVELEGEILGKPRDEAEARAMLRRLSGRTHRVWTGVTVRRGDEHRTESVCTAVEFRPLSEEEIRAYVSTGEPLDKAGAYGYQGLACLFVEEIRGDYFNVVGLPLCRLGRMLRAFDLDLLPPASGRESEDRL